MFTETGEENIDLSTLILPTGTGGEEAPLLFPSPIRQHFTLSREKLLAANCYTY